MRRRGPRHDRLDVAEAPSRTAHPDLRSVRVDRHRWRATGQAIGAENRDPHLPPIRFGDSPFSDGPRSWSFLPSTGTLGRCPRPLFARIRGQSTASSAQSIWARVTPPRRCGRRLRQRRRGTQAAASCALFMRRSGVQSAGYPSARGRSGAGIIDSSVGGSKRRFPWRVRPVTGRRCALMAGGCRGAPGETAAVRATLRFRLVEGGSGVVVGEVAGQLAGGCRPGLRRSLAFCSTRVGPRGLLRAAGGGGGPRTNQGLLSL